jgi:hypothetical protein
MMNEPEAAEGRRSFFRSLGRGVILGAVGAGAAWMATSGRLDLEKCVNEQSPCNRCLQLPAGCELPKAVTFRKGKSHGGS